MTRAEGGPGGARGKGFKGRVSKREAKGMAWEGGSEEAGDIMHPPS